MEDAPFGAARKVARQLHPLVRHVVLQNLLSGPGYIDGSLSYHGFRLPILLPTPRVTRRSAQAPPR